MQNQRLIWPLLACLALPACTSDEAAETPTGATCPTDSTVTYDGFVAPFMAQYCTRCHGSEVPATERQGAPLDHNFDQLDGILEAAEHIDTASAAGPDATNEAMPPSGDTPTLEERKKLGEWIACQLHELEEAGDAGAHAHSHDE